MKRMIARLVLLLMYGTPESLRRKPVPEDMPYLTSGPETKWWSFLWRVALWTMR